MAEHFKKSQIERFSVSALPEDQLDTIAQHLAECEGCHQMLVKTLRSQRGTEGLKFSLDPDFLFRHEHLEYEQLVGVAENKMDVTEREVIDLHLSTCATCREDVRSFLAFRKQVEPELRVRYGPTTTESRRKKGLWVDWWGGVVWNPAYAAAVVIIAIALVIGVALLLKRRAADLEAKQTKPPQQIIGPATQTPTPENQAINIQPTPAPIPSEQLPRPAASPALAGNQEGRKSLENAGVVAALIDGQGTVTVDKAGNVSGLDEIPQNTRHEIGQALLAENIKVPAIETELAGTPINLRGPGSGPTFKLLSPGRTVIISDRPSFEWEGLTGATSYRVSVGDLNGHEIAKSEELSADQTRWTPPTSLKRGEIYAWEVEGTIDGKKVVSPGGSAPQMKFKILSVNSARELEQLKIAPSHLGLGVFYAREGMVDEAEREFEILVHDNPRSSVLRKLLKQIQSWRKH
jgi:hypothetical protein